MSTQDTGFHQQKQNGDQTVHPSIEIEYPKIQRVCFSYYLLANKKGGLSDLTRIAARLCQKTFFFFFLDGEPVHRNYALNGLVLPEHGVFAIYRRVPQRGGSRVHPRPRLLNKVASHCKRKRQEKEVGETKDEVRQRKS